MAKKKAKAKKRPSLADRWATDGPSGGFVRVKPAVNKKKKR